MPTLEKYEEWSGKTINHNDHAKLPPLSFRGQDTNSWAVIQVNRWVTYSLLLDYWLTVLVVTGLTAACSFGKYRKCGRFIQMNEDQTWKERMGRNV